MGIIELHSWRNWIACQPPTLKVVGSIPAGCTTHKSPFMGLFCVVSLPHRPTGFVRREEECPLAEAFRRRGARGGLPPKYPRRVHHAKKPLYGAFCVVSLPHRPTGFTRRAAAHAAACRRSIPAGCTKRRIKVRLFCLPRTRARQNVAQAAVSAIVQIQCL